MFTTRTRITLAVPAALLAAMVPAVPAPAIPSVPGQPPAVRLQGAATTVTVTRPKGTRDVYVRATTLKRTLGGALMRSTSGTPIRVTVTRPMIRGGRVVAKVSAGATGQGASQATCDRAANVINQWDTFVGGAMANNDWASVSIGAANFEEAIEAALDVGCFVVL